VRSVVRKSPDPFVVWRCAECQPFSTNALNGSSVRSVNPVGSFAHVPPDGGGGGGGGGCTAPAVVVPLATFDNAPNTASTFSVPRNSTTSNVYALACARPSTVQVRRAPIVVPARTPLQVPMVTGVADPQDSVPAPQRTS